MPPLDEPPAPPEPIPTTDELLDERENAARDGPLAGPPLPPPDTTSVSHRTPEAVAGALRRLADRVQHGGLVPMSFDVGATKFVEHADESLGMTSRGEVVVGVLMARSKPIDWDAMTDDEHAAWDREALQWAELAECPDDEPATLPAAA